MLDFNNRLSNFVKDNITNDNLISGIVDILKNEFNISNDKIKLIMTLFKNNIRLFETLSLDFVLSDLFMTFGFIKLEYIVSLSPVQNNLLKLNDKEKYLFITLIKQYADEYYWPAYFSALLNNFLNSTFKPLISSVDDVNSVNLKELSLVLTSKSTNIMNLDELNNKKQALDYDIDLAKKNGNLDNYKDLCLKQKFNLSLDEAKIICQKYCYKIENVQSDNYQKLLEFLKRLKMMVLAKSFDEFDQVINTLGSISLEYPNYQTLIQQMYAGIYNEVLFNPDGMNYEMYEGVKIIDAGVEFKMISRANGAFSQNSDTDIVANYSDAWNAPSRKNYSFSNSHVSNSRLFMYSLASNRPLITYGFCNLDKNAIVESSLGDNATMATRTKTMDPRAYSDFYSINPITYDGCGQRFLAFDDMINFSGRDVYTEISLERFVLGATNETRTMPSYIVYAKLSDDYLDDSLFKSSLKAARDFDIPLVIIDVEKVLESEKNKLNQMIQGLDNDFTVQRIFNIFQLYANNAINMIRPDVKEIINKYFPIKIEGENICEEMLNSFLERAKKLNMPSSFYQELFDRLMVLNAQKKIFSALYMLRFKTNHPEINEDLEQYADELYGITVSDDPNKVKTCFYGYFALEQKITLCEEIGLPVTPNILSISYLKFKNNVDLCREYNASVTEERVMMTTYELTKLLKSEANKNDEFEM